jgi:hypothetical protein
MQHSLVYFVFVSNTVIVNNILTVVMTECFVNKNEPYSEIVCKKMSTKYLSY